MLVILQQCTFSPQTDVRPPFYTNYQDTATVHTQKHQ